MTKVEYAKCEKLMEEAIQKAEQAKKEFDKTELENDFVGKNILLAMAYSHLGYADGINQTLAVIGFKHERMKELSELV